MSKRTFVRFKAEFPNEAQWTENGSPLVPDGHSIAVVLAEALKTSGLLPSEVSQHSFYGWAFDVVFAKRRIWCLLQGGDPWLLLVEERNSGLCRLFWFSSSNEMDMVLQAIDRALEQDTRFSSIRWFTKQEYKSGCQGGADSPL